MITCMECKHYPPKKEWPCVYCLDHDWYEKQQTNADRFRAMTDEKLAEALCLIAGGQGPVSSADGRDWLDWLRQEAI